MNKRFIDCLGEMCPIPVIKAEEEFKKLNPGESFVLETDHSCAPLFIKKQLKKYKCKIKVKEVDFGIWQVTVEKC
ncbi:MULTISPECIES: sulfurtransferase TusA family protein [Carboxydothermus]|uniref:UPF0033 domain-containing protein n=2 Tax=Carboxydothermus TaxID=129957 RepID=Q3AEF3_CARHZ|nr:MULTISPECIES: sulfurtransferase TusA family protein [Carboxydothermus]ABB14446.1 conserved hypothetical protein [Carboxydothermus hydrogenoformans Z-2901]NYE56498.1 TusA-related sulfurtransferase [Carboxydothermus ferrireducens DSM 11255]